MIAIYCSKLKNSPMIAQCIEVEGAGGWEVGRAGGGAEGQKSQHRLRPLSSQVITHNLLKNM
jgi:hypothetical protein